MRYYLFYNASQNVYLNALGNSFKTKVIVESKNDIEAEELAANIVNRQKIDMRITELEERYLTDVFYESEEQQMKKIASVLPEKLANWAIQKMLDEQSERSYDREDLFSYFQDMVDELKNCISCENVQQ